MPLQFKTKIHIQNLKVECLIGVRDYEKVQPQPLIVHLQCEYESAAALRSDCIKDAVDYSTLASEIKTFLTHHQFALLERLSCALICHLIKNFPIQNIHLKIEKPKALNNLADVSIEMSANY